MPMNCPYCRTVNDSAESRCVRCGRRLQGAARPQSISGGYGGAALAVQPALESTSQAAVAEIPQPSAGSSYAPEVQPSLFRDAGPNPKVVPIPTLTPLRPGSPLDRETVRRTAARVSKSTRPAGQQQSFPLQEERSLVRPEEALYCDARVALPTHRAVAATVDAVVVLLGTMLFGAVAFFAGVDFGLTRNILILPAAIGVVVLVLYRGLWCLANADTPGMRFAGLQLVDFDGRRPKRQQRILRQFAGGLSLAAAAVGLLWALVDEESLTWHDHISKTFPTAP
jgi:uncharacterized RDD family membrane protein YckC